MTENLEIFLEVNWAGMMFQPNGFLRATTNTVTTAFQDSPCARYKRDFLCHPLARPPRGLGVQLLKVRTPESGPAATEGKDDCS